jgi:class 3 adenylate cyclase/tetratricopeptide (TPR) repeat protein
MRCQSCGTENTSEAKFCHGCGAALGLICAACGTPYAEGHAFCEECGARLGSGAPAPTGLAPPAQPQPQAFTAERRLVSVLFADLVGFTAASEARDAEETRELLSAYFDSCRRLIERYGGTVEKFIGDAVMAVWGTPIAKEDDAERAVRAALDLVTAVPELEPTLRARAGVLTGEAAVTLGAEGEGMVAGDLVNTASRIQSAAEPGSVLVGEATRRASDAAIAYEPAGEHELKGKSEPVPLYRALRITAGRRGALKSAGLEPPFVGRKRELRLVKELFHASAEEGKAHLVSVVGIAGTGKSRLGWEFFKYTDGLSEELWWHRGRCLAYGEGVAYWALAEMVRSRAQVAEGEEQDSARAKLQVALDDYIPDQEERRFVEARLAELLGLEDGTSRSKEELFGAWRLLFERLAATAPVVLVFEDMQWADSSLIEFVAHLLEWSRDHPIFVLCLGRAELQQRQPELGRASRSQTTLFLEPLAADSMEALLDGFVPGLPEDLRGQILARAEGVPLYAVETVRMLLDRRLLVQEGGVYRPTGPIEQLDVPETLHGLLAARLDGLEPQERRLLQDASVLGKTFTPEALAAISESSETDVEPLLAGLVRKEVLGVQADPRSPELGQYGFLQDLVRRVAYETLAKKERKSRHLAAAAHLEQSYGAAEHEIVEIVASHFLAAYEVQPEAEDATAIKAKAVEMLERAGERAASLAASEEARRYFERAAELADESVERARMLERGGLMAVQNAEPEPAKRLFRSALELLEAAGETHAVARVSARLAVAMRIGGQGDEAIDQMERAFASVASDEPDEDVATLAAHLGRAYWFAGTPERGLEPNELALRLAQEFRLPEVLCQTLSTKAVILRSDARPEEELALLRHALRVALDNDLTDLILAGYGNLSDAYLLRDRYEEALGALSDALPLARRVGNRRRELYLLSEISYATAMSGRWQEALEAFGELPDERLGRDRDLTSPLNGVLEVLLHRGELAQARNLLQRYEGLDTSGDVYNQGEYAGARAALAHAEGRFADALAAGTEAAQRAAVVGAGHQGSKQGRVWALEAALQLGETERAAELLRGVDELPAGLRPPFLEAHASRVRARMDANETGFTTAAALFREYGLPLWLAVTELEHAEWLLEQGRGNDAEPLLAEASEIFERLEAKPWLERVGRTSRAHPPAEAVSGS